MTNEKVLTIPELVGVLTTRRRELWILEKDRQKIETAYREAEIAVRNAELELRDAVRRTTEPGAE